MAAPNKQGQLVCSREDVIASFKQRRHVTVQDREITIYHHNNTFYALDKQCYHAGGPLFNGDIEECAGHSCIVCPWHKYKIRLDTGESIYQNVDPKNLDGPRLWRSMGNKQRTHVVEEREGNLYVTLNTEGKLDSDYYYSEEYKEIMTPSKDI